MQRLVGAGAQNGIPYRMLGRSGAKVSLLGIGGFHLGQKPTEGEAIRIVRTALDEGVNFLDNCWDYNEGQSEVRMGKALRDGYRERAFLMTKLDSHSKAGAMRQIDESLSRLQTDHVDLIQFHEVIRPGDPEKIFSAGGSFEAVVAAQKAGKVRFIGFTGHKDPAIHLAMLGAARERGFHFDSVQMPLNVMDAQFRSFGQQVLPVLVREEIGVLGMKPLGSGKILESGLVTATECLHFAMNLPVSVVITGCDSLGVLQQALEAVRSFRPLPPEVLETLLSRTAPAASEGQHEGYKMTQQFDGTVHHPEWLG